MGMFGRGSGGHRFSEMLRGMKHSPTGEPASAPEKGGVGPKKMSTKVPSADRHMSALDKEKRQPGGVMGRTAKAWPNRPGVRIAQGSAGTSGRVIHHKPTIERKGTVPGHQSVINRTSSRRTKKSKNLGSSGMSNTVSGRPGVPGHQSVINRGPNPKGGYVARKMSRSRVMNMASKISY